MMQSLPGLFKNTELALRKSHDDHACMLAFSIGEMIDNLRLVKDGEATIEDFFKTYVFDSQRRNLADSVDAKHFLCMQDEVEDSDVD